MHTNASFHPLLAFLGRTTKGSLPSQYLFGFVGILVWLHSVFLDLLTGSLFELGILFLGKLVTVLRREVTSPFADSVWKNSQERWEEV